MTYLHEKLSPDRWYKLSLMEQMANVGSEIFRTISWRQKDKEYSVAAFYRGLALTDLTLSDPKNRERLREITRAREVLVDWFLGGFLYHSTDADWQKYFMAFNLAARK